MHCNLIFAFFFFTGYMSMRKCEYTYIEFLEYSEFYCLW